MADFALKLPDHDLTANEFKELARRVGRAAFVPLFVRFYERVITSEASIEEQRRALADIAKWVGVEEDRKVDPNANLPMFNIIFGAPSAAGNTSMQMVEVITEIPPPPPALDPEELAIIEKLVRQPHANPPPDESRPAPAQEDGQRRRADEPEPERAEALHDAPAAERRALRDGDPIVEPPQASHAAPEEIVADSYDGFEDALASLDSALGL